MTNHELASHLSSLNALPVPNPLDSYRLTECLIPIQWQVEQQKDPNINASQRVDRKESTCAVSLFD